MSRHYPERRSSHRNLSILSVRCRVSQGFAPEVWLTDLSAEGCHLLIRAGTLRQDQRVVIKADGIEGLAGTVKWVVNGHAGVIFNRVLHEAIVDHLLTGSAAAQRDDKPAPRSAIPAPPLLGPMPMVGKGRRSCL